VKCEVVAPTLVAVKMHAVIEALQSLRGIAQISAVSIMAELGELSSFARPRQLMGYSGARHGTWYRLLSAQITTPPSCCARSGCSHIEHLSLQ